MGKIIHIDSCENCPYCHKDKHETEYSLYYCTKEKAIVSPETINSICKLEDHPIDKYWSDEDDMIIGIDKGSSEGDHSAEITFDTSKLSKEERELINKPINLNGSISIQEVEGDD